MTRIEQLERTALAEMRSKFEDVLYNFHQNACYPKADEAEIKTAVEKLLDVVSDNIRHPMFVNR
jgi:hypothetical protein